MTGHQESATGLSTFVEYWRLTKPRIELLIVISTAVGFCYGVRGSFNALLFIHCVLGTALMAAGSAVLNQWYEFDVDALMNRTKRRAIPLGVISRRQALLFGVALSLVGACELLVCTNRLAAALGVFTAVTYLFAYTPLKRRTPVATTVGALPGAMPPLIGFAAANQHLNEQAWVLAAILFLWQFPHFHAIAWLYREDYRRAGIRMLAVVRPRGLGLSIEILTALALLIPFTIAPTVLKMAGNFYLAAACVLDIAFLFFGVRMVQERNLRRARHLLLASVIYVPILFAFLVFDSPAFRL